VKTNDEMHLRVLSMRPSLSLSLSLSLCNFNHTITRLCVTVSFTRKHFIETSENSLLSAASAKLQTSLMISVNLREFIPIFDEPR